MADLQSFKIKYDGVLRRVSLPKTPVLTYAALVDKVCALFNISDRDAVVITYFDDEEDEVTMADDHDVEDAVTVQELNPLHLTVVLKNSKKQASAFTASGSQEEERKTRPAQTESEQIAEGFSKEFKSIWDQALKDMKRGGSKDFLKSLEPLIATAPRNLANVVDVLLKGDSSSPPESSFVGGKKGVNQSNSPKTTKDSVGDPQSKEDKVNEGKGGEPGVEDNKEKVFHVGVQCDVCGMMPISGVRYQSNTKYDYDMCANCYAAHGVEGEYNKIERPVLLPPPMAMWTHGNSFHSRLVPDPFSSPRGVPLRAGRAYGCGRTSSCRSSFDGKLDDRRLNASFVADVTVFDGTEMPPGTAFTKIWRLKNNGTVVWPQFTRLVRMEGDHFGHVDYVEVPLPEGGLKPDEEVEVSVDMVAPEQPGRYISHWRLMAPGARKFGHRVWTLIQVVPNDEPSPQVAESVTSLSKRNEGNYSSSKNEDEFVSNEFGGEVVPDAEVEAEVDSPTTEKTSVGGFSLVNHSEVDLPVQDEMREQTEQVPVQIEVVDLSKLPVHIVGGEGVVVEKKELTDEELTIEEKLEQLQAMGFADRTVNYETLKEYGFDVEKTLEKLLAAAEWDPMLQELEEMGFNDTTTNRLLMMKNNGSIKLVVKELVQKYKGKN